MILEYKVNSYLKYTTIKEVLRAHFNMSKRLITKLKKNNMITLNNKITFLDKEIKIGDTIKCNLDFEESSENIVPTKMNLNIVFEDDSFLVINKAPGICVHPSILHYEDSLSNGVKYYFEQNGINKKIRPVNRLDKDTSGLVIFAKNEYVQECLIYQMKSKTFNKKYFALLNGNLDKPFGVIDAPISRKEGSIIERCVDTNGYTSITNYKLIKNYNDFCLVEFDLQTGRTHQIRVHCKFIGHPILGDTLYGEKSNLISRQALHCYYLSFIHPITFKNMVFEIQLPEDMNKLLV